MCLKVHSKQNNIHSKKNTSFFIEDLMAAHNLAQTLQTIKFLESRRCRSWTSQQRIQRSQLPVAPPVHESGSSRTTPPDMRNQGIPHPQRRMPMHPLRRTIRYVLHYRVHKKDIDTIPLCKGYKRSVINDL